jgi:FMN phosphatase YigB (HAD superfamily)
MPCHLADPQTNNRESTQLARADERITRTPKAIIFDIGRVIVRLDLRRALTPIAAAIGRVPGQPSRQLSPEETWGLIRADDHWQDWQEGRISPTDWHQHLMRRLNLSLSYAEFRDTWNLVLDPETILSESLFVQLGSRCRLALLSNTDPLHVECMEQEFAFGRHFPVRIYSCSIGMSKPSPVIYKAALERLDVEAEDALYVDDIQEFVDAARHVGLDAIRFETREQLEQELRRRQLV